MRSTLARLALVATGLLAWFALYQIVPLYVGYRMLSDKVVEGTFEERVEALDNRPATYAEVKAERAEEAAERAEEAADTARDAAEDAVDSVS